MNIIDSPLIMIGNTPLYKLKKVNADLTSTILCKLEYMNPTGSIKDRVALRMIQDAEKDGKLKQGYTIIEATTGNMGIALSMVGAVFGYKVILFLPQESSSKERIGIMKDYGAETVILGPEMISKDVDRSIHGSFYELRGRAKCKELEETQPDMWWARQFCNPSNAMAHRDGTGAEIVKQAGCKVDAFVASIGTGGTLIGVAMKLREKNPDTKIVAVEPAGHPILSKENMMIIKGINDGFILEMREKHLVDHTIQIKNEEAIAMARRVAGEEGLYCGVSAGANILASLKIAHELGKGKTIVTVLPDNRYRYLGEEKYIT